MDSSTTTLGKALYLAGELQEERQKNATSEQKLGELAAKCEQLEMENQSLYTIVSDLTDSKVQNGSSNLDIGLDHIGLLVEKCDSKENELSEMSHILTVLKGENISLKERIEQLERCKSTTPEELCFIDMMSDEYAKYREKEQDVLEFLCPSLFNDVMILIEEAKAENSISDQVKVLENQIGKFERSNSQLSSELGDLNKKIEDFEKIQRKLENELELKEEALEKCQETIRKLKEDVKVEVSKADELKCEVSKQRLRAQEEIDTRDREIEAFRKMLVNFRHEKMEKPTARKISRHSRNSTHDDDSTSFRRSRIFSQDEGTANVPNDPDSKNVFYENQLTKKEYDIQKLRKQLLDLEVRLREGEQVAMTRQLDSVAGSHIDDSCFAVLLSDKFQEVEHELRDIIGSFHGNVFNDVKDVLINFLAKNSNTQQLQDIENQLMSTQCVNYRMLSRQKSTVDFYEAELKQKDMIIEDLRIQTGLFKHTQI